MLKMYRVYYEENIAYEDYVEAVSEEEAKEIFVNTLEIDDDFEPITADVLEFEAEEVEHSFQGVTPASKGVRGKGYAFPLASNERIIMWNTRRQGYVRTPIRYGVQHVLGDYVTVMEVARRLSITKQAIRARIRRGQLPAIKIADMWVIKRSDVRLNAFERWTV